MSNREAPQVQDGPRGPMGGSSPVAYNEAAPAAPFAAPKKKVIPPPDPDLVRYRSRYLGYRIQITAPADVFEAVTGRVIRARPVVAQFQHGRYETKNPEIIKILDNSGRYGIGLDFWRAELQEKAEAAKAVQEAMQKVGVVKGLPPEQQAVVDALLDTLRGAVVGTAFELPPARIGEIRP